MQLEVDARWSAQKFESAIFILMHFSWMGLDRQAYQLFELLYNDMFGCFPFNIRRGTMHPLVWSQNLSERPVV